MNKKQLNQIKQNVTEDLLRLTIKNGRAVKPSNVTYLDSVQEVGKYVIFMVDCFVNEMANLKNTKTFEDIVNFNQKVQKFNNTLEELKNTPTEKTKKPTAVKRRAKKTKKTKYPRENKSGLSSLRG